MHTLSPFKLIPQYREYVWGGNRIRPEAERTAEAWVVYENNQIADGPMAGITLGKAAEEYGEALLGSRVIEQTGVKFPLLVKILDAAMWLSLQVHPNNEQAQRWEGAGHFGKMEGWYVIAADEGAQLISGFKPGVGSEEIASNVGTKSLLELVSWNDVHIGDSLLIEPGTLHALGPGLMVYEVQQTSDITYRVYDWDRPKQEGRDLHLEQAADVLNPDALGALNGLEPNFLGQKDLFSCQFFKLELLSGLETNTERDTEGVSFQTITVVEGGAQVSGKDWQTSLNCFETIVIPASIGEYQIKCPEGACLVARVPAQP